jgi:Xaa-Pro aminopeptidase
VREAPALAGADDRAMFSFDTLTWVPIDRRLILPGLMTAQDRAWLNSYHAACLDKIGPRISDAARVWLTQATAPL